jgi:hypothetical protein
MARDVFLIFRIVKRKLFARWPERPNHIERVEEISFCAQGFSTETFLPKGRSIRISSPSGKSVDDSDARCDSLSNKLSTCRPGERRNPLPLASVIKRRISSGVTIGREPINSELSTDVRFGTHSRLKPDIA